MITTEIKMLFLTYKHFKLVEPCALLKGTLLAYAVSISGGRLTVHYCKINLYPSLSPPCASLLFYSKVEWKSTLSCKALFPLGDSLVENKQAEM